MNCKHKFKIHDIEIVIVNSTSPQPFKRATVVCEKCGLVKVNEVIYETH